MIAEQHLLALPAGYRLGKYVFKGLLGSGGFGITYLAEDTSLHRKVAIKEMLPNEFATRIDGTTVVAKTQSDKTNLDWARARFIDEGRALAACDHPNVINVYEMIEANGTAYMVTKYEEGSNLERWLQKLGHRPSESDLREILAPLLSGLDRVHRAGFLHRDIKPENIYMTNEGRPVLLDFGSARQAIRSRSMVMTSIITPGYAPFEQYHEDGNQGPWTDIYAMGGVMYRAIVGKKPPDAVSRFASDTCEKLALNYAASYSGSFVKAIDRALNVKEAERPQTVSEWREMLGTDTASHSASSTSDTTEFLTPKTPRKAELPIVALVRKNPVWVLAGGVVLVAALVGIGVFAWSNQPHNSPATTQVTSKTVGEPANDDNKLAEEKNRVIASPTPIPVVAVSPSPTPIPQPTAPLVAANTTPMPAPTPPTRPAVVVVNTTPQPVVDTVPQATPVQTPPAALSPAPSGSGSLLDPKLVGRWQTKQGGDGETEIWEIRKDGTWSFLHTDGSTEAEGTLTVKDGKMQQVIAGENKTLDFTYTFDDHNQLVTSVDGKVAIWHKAAAPRGPSTARHTGSRNPRPQASEGFGRKILRFFGH
jgi:serine/threonine protein kinase